MSAQAPVSVIIPCYRCAETIARAVESVVAQTLPPAEIVLVEDHSSDEGRTLQSLRALQQTYRGAGIKVIPQAANGGAGVARNRGWDEATQPYIAFLDADDAWHRRKLEIQYGWLAAHPEVEFCGHLIEVVSAVSELGRPLTTVSASKIGRISWLASCRFSTISVMLRRDLPFRFAPDMRFSEDYALWLRIVLSGHHAWRLEVPLAFCFKPLYGAGGLTQNLWKMERGALEAYKRAYQEGLISRAIYLGFSLLSLLKYVRRAAIARLLHGGPKQK